MNRRFALLAVASATALAGLVAAPAHAEVCEDRTIGDARVRVCVHDDGSISCGGRVGDRMIFMCA